MDKSIVNLINHKIEGIRPKILDLSRRNPLISTTFSIRSNSHIRVVDEQPNFLFKTLKNNERLKLAHLPPLDADPKDEQTEDFKTEYEKQKQLDEDYLKFIEDNPSIDYFSEDLNKEERKLKDKVRKILGLPERPDKKIITMVEHARINNISSSYDLPDKENFHDDGRHVDNEIQTLLLKDQLEKKSNSLISKSKSFIDETGINVLQGAFGFLEWKDNNNDKLSLAPLILLPIQITKKISRKGAEFWLNGIEGEFEVNTVLIEKLKIDNNIDLPKDVDEDIEVYFQKINKTFEELQNFRVRRQVAFGIFPSSKIEMYHDLDTKNTNFYDNNIINTLLAGSENSMSTSIYGEDYDIDKENLDHKVPYLVMDADASQFSALLDIQERKNLSIEGPPGTGKSQTIVNVIADSLSKNKKVLFIAEKKAALDVVKARLDALDLGDFAFQVQANKSKKEAYESIKDRLELSKRQFNDNYEFLLKNIEDTRDNIKSYINILSKNYKETGIKIYKILGKSIFYSEIINDLPNDLVEHEIINLNYLSNDSLLELEKVCRLIKDAWSEKNNNLDNWEITSKLSLSPFEIDSILNLTGRIYKNIENGLEQRKKIIKEYDLNIKEDNDLLLFKKISEIDYEIDNNFLINVFNNDKTAFYDNFINNNKEYEDLKLIISNVVNFNNLPSHEDVESLNEFIESTGVNSIDNDAIKIHLEESKKNIEGTNKYQEISKNIKNKYPKTSNYSLKIISDIILTLNGYDDEVLNLRDFNHFKFKDCLKVFSEYQLQLNDINRKKLLVEENINFIDKDINELIDNLKTYSKSGLLSYFSKKYRNSKKVVSELLIENDFSKNEKKDVIEKYTNYCLAVKDFKKKSEGLKLFNQQYLKNDTNYLIYENLFNLYINILNITNDNNELLKIAINWESNFLNYDDKIINHDLDIYKNKSLDDLIDSNLKSKTFYEKIINNENFLKIIRDKFVQKNIGKGNINEIAKNMFLYLKHKVLQEQLLSELQLEDHQLNNLENIINHYDLVSGIDDSPFKKQIINSLETKLFKEIVKNCSNYYKSITLQVELVSEFNNIVDIKNDSLIKNDLSDNNKKLFEELFNDKKGLIAHTNYNQFISESNQFSLDYIIKYISNKYKALDKLFDYSEAILFRNLTKNVYKEYINLPKFNGSNLNLLINEFKAVDKKIIKINQNRIKNYLISNASPPVGTSRGKKSEYTELSLIENEINKKARHRPIRYLTKHAGSALLEIMPCWMMSPHAVARFIEKNNIIFDLVVIDEASQMTPENAIGALFRAKNALIVGDTNQLPPTNFFKKVFTEDGNDEDEDILEESILEMANMTFKPIRRLKWHYRSRHSSLIAFSNKYIYDNSLIIFPSSHEDKKGMGVSLRYVDGLYSSQTNFIEAQQLVDQAINIMTNRPNKSMGIVSLNIKQKELIEEMLTQRIESNKKALEYKYNWDEQENGLEKLFIKNLENVQGDERDIILISTVYGPEKKGGPVMKRFGPINGLAGKRRLNVLFTRAKDQIITFTSMTSHNLNVDENSNPGAYLLKLWLEYSETGKMLDIGPPKQPDSDFERFVINQLEKNGFIAQPQVGVAGYFIDIGVKHPDYKHGYIMAVECDGASYHSSKSARDRDRLRQEVIEGLGWEFHRIWSTDWFNDPKAETERLINNLNNKLDILLKSKPAIKNISSKIDKRNYLNRNKLINDTTPKQIQTSLQIDTFEQLEFKVSDNDIRSKEISINSEVKIEFLDNNKKRQFIIIDGPNDLENGFLSSKAPLANTIMGSELGDIVDWDTAGFIREIKIIGVKQMEVQ